ncbi:Z1 domain-containing protein [Kocuria palustris]|uniref:Z1 domain-containing protein n=1 Tax=Kocuria palustris TaxID=71999 RepID=UPI0021A659D6|nr:Z1 domain-containing protein [Kocuria palustris]MCT1833200.1 Z1 domain-containing protein [Kocuria palustris]
MPTKDELEFELRRLLNSVVLRLNADIGQQDLNEKALSTWEVFLDHDAALSAPEVLRIAQEVGEQNRLKLEPTGEMRAEDFRPWLEERLQATELPHWKAYRGILEEQGRSNNVLQHLDRQTDRIVELMGDPLATGPWSRKGLAIGEVQSGKTATYAGALNKAIDLGYRIIIVIGGHTEDLRRQTQERLDHDLIGRDTSHSFQSSAVSSSPSIGVGKARELERNLTHPYTSTRFDFSKTHARSHNLILDGENPYVFVVKKNYTILNQLADFLRQQADGDRLDIPMILVDDESDWASVNTAKDEDDRTAVNDAIINVLGASSQSSYLGITATPFANVLIDHEQAEDLFPKDYIVALSSPPEYCGVDFYFRQDGAGEKNIVTRIEDFHKALPRKHKKHDRLFDIPQSLKDAVLAFFIASAERRRRANEEAPVSMMVNASRFKAVQANIHQLLKDHVTEVSQQIISARRDIASKALSTSIGQALEELRRDQFPEVRFEQIVGQLVDIASTVSVDLINGDTKTARERELSGKTRAQLAALKRVPTIYVGGDVLARGITLEGLIVSYFPRAASAADTLLQMGRWFGYRPGYADLTRVWMDEEVVDHFRYISGISEDLRFSVTVMGEQNRLPIEFGLKIRRHPESFKITAANKARHAAELNEPGSFSYRGVAFETWGLTADRTENEKNKDAISQFLDKVDSASGSAARRSLGNKTGQGSIIWNSVPHELVEGLLSHFNNPGVGAYEVVFGFGEDGIPAGIEEIGERDGWNVAVISGDGERRLELNSTGVAVNGSVRNAASLQDGNIVLGNRRVATSNDLWKTMNSADQQSLLQKLREIRPDSEVLQKATSATQPQVLRYGINRPTLLIYSIVVSQEDSDQMSSRPNTAAPRIRELGHAPAMVLATPAPTEAEEHDAMMSGDETQQSRYFVNTVYQAEVTQADRNEEVGDDS